MDSRIEKILFNLADAAATAADGVTDVVQNAGHKVGEKYDVLRLNVEIARLQDEQDKIFASIGHTMYQLQTGDVKPEAAEQEAEGEGAQQTVDHLLLLADQKQQEIDAARHRLSLLTGTADCPGCGRPAANDDVFCAKCGTKLGEE